jgi:hypothetical protein
MITRRGRLGLTFTAILVLVWTLTPAPIPIPIEIEIQRTKPAIDKGPIDKGPVSYEQKLQNKKLAARYAYLAFGWEGRERECLIALWTRESRFDNHARPLDSEGRPRSSAFGIAQHLGETSRDPATQILRGLRYISYRFDTPCRADAFQKRNNYY